MCVCVHVCVCVCVCVCCVFTYVIMCVDGGCLCVQLCTREAETLRKEMLITPVSFAS